MVFRINIISLLLLLLVQFFYSAAKIMTFISILTKLCQYPLSITYWTKKRTLPYSSIFRKNA